MTERKTDIHQAGTCTITDSFVLALGAVVLNSTFRTLADSFSQSHAINFQWRLYVLDWFHGTYGSCSVTLRAISKASASFVGIQPLFLHPNIVMMYGIAPLSDSQHVLVMESLATSFEQLIVELNDQLTLRERVDLSLGCVSSVDYLHRQIGITHGLLNCRNIFCSSLLTAKVVDPVATRLMTGDHAIPTVTVYDDLVQLGHVLLKLFGVLVKTEFRADPPNKLHASQSLYNIVECLMKEDRINFPTAEDMVSALNAMRETDRYRQCPSKRMYKASESGSLSKT